MPVPNVGNANADLAIATLHPAERPDRSVPEGERPARFAEAPVKGPLSTGEASGISVPNLTLREDPNKPADLSTSKFTTVLYAEAVRNIPTATLSAPLRPASRMIPRTIEDLFRGRYVYTLVIPIENLPVYQGDWIVWFAEKNQGPGNSPLMRAPVPFRKLEPVGGAVRRNETEQRLQFAGTITREGKIERISMLTKAGSAIEKTVIQDLASWNFKPATRDDLPVDVDVVVEIPFNSSVIAERGHP